jgi:hypothetical protein
MTAIKSVSPSHAVVGMNVSQPNDKTSSDDTDVTKTATSARVATKVAIEKTYASPRTCKNTPCMFIDPCECPCPP